jgi:hypothetical protein
MHTLGADPRSRSLLLCLLTFVIGVGFITAFLRWDIPAEVAKNRTRPKTGTPVTPAPSAAAPAGVVVTPAPTPPSVADEERLRNALLTGLQSSFNGLKTLEAGILTPNPAGQLVAAGHFYFSKSEGEDISNVKLKVEYTSLPVTQMLLAENTVKVLQPTRKLAVMRDAKEAADDWLKDYKDLTENINLALLDAGDLNAQRPASLEIRPRQPKNVKRAVVFVDLHTHLPVRLEVDFPHKKQIVAFDKAKIGQPIDPKSFELTLPPGMKWTSQ